jgi:hypothetical protein
MRDRKTQKYLHLAGTAFHNEAAALERRPDFLPDFLPISELRRRQAISPV